MPANSEQGKKSILHFLIQIQPLTHKKSTKALEYKESITITFQISAQLCVKNVSRRNFLVGL